MRRRLAVWLISLGERVRENAEASENLPECSKEFTGNDGMTRWLCRRRSGHSGKHSLNTESEQISFIPISDEPPLGWKPIAEHFKQRSPKKPRFARLSDWRWPRVG